MMNLKIGQELQLKEVIKILLDEEMKNGSSLKRQIKAINNMITYEEVPKTRPKRVIITNIIQQQEEDDDTTLLDVTESQKQELIKLRGKYQKLIAPMLLMKLKNSPDNSLLLTHTSIMQRTGLVNEKYISKRKKIFDTSKELEIHPSNLLHFNNVVGEEFNRIVKRELEKMVDKKIIDIEKIMMIQYYIKDDKGNSYPEYKTATKEMIDIIKVAQYKVLKKMNTTITEVNKSKTKRNKYFKDVNKMVKKNIEFILYRDLNLDINCDIYFSKCYESCKISSLDAIIDCELQDKKYVDYMKELNNIAIEFANKNTQNIRNSKTRINDLKSLRESKQLNDRMLKENMTVEFLEGYGDDGIINSYIKDVEIIIENLIVL